jgi:hypothetical protein
MTAFFRNAPADLQERLDAVDAVGARQHGPAFKGEEKSGFVMRRSGLVARCRSGEAASAR